MEVMEKNGDAYRLSPGVSPFLDRSSPTCMLDALQFNMDLYQLWGRLGTCMKEGKPVLPPSAHLGDDPARTRRFTLGMHSRALAMAPALIPSLEMKGCSSLLDVGSGPGTFSRVLAETYPKLNVTLFDLPPVLAIGKELIGQTGVASRIKFHNGDYRKDPVPTGFDAVLYCGALHQEEPEGARRLFGKLYDSVNPGGRLYVVDIMLAADRTQPLFSVLFSLNMMLISPQGRVFAEEDVLHCVGQAGFEKARCLKPKGCPYWVVKAGKAK
jgi:SAM-dependent methyltransferase